MLEFLIALLIFSLGMMGLLSAQLVGKKAGYEAQQRSIATALARDILERMRANAGQVALYQLSNAGDANQRLPRPRADCDRSECTADQLAAFDVWQWESLLLGEPEQHSGGNAAGLVSPRACITTDGGAVSVAISWRGVTAARQAMAVDCGNDVFTSGAPPGEAVNTWPRRQLTLSTFIGES